MTGKQLNPILGHLHFWPSLVCMNLIFFPMMIQGMAGFHRRWYNGGTSFPETTKDYLWMNGLMSNAAFIMALAQLPFVINFFYTLFLGKKIKDDNPWHATTLEWATPTPPPHGNFIIEPIANRGPYEYAAIGITEDYLPQWAPLTAHERANGAVDLPATEPAPTHAH